MPEDQPDPTTTQHRPVDVLRSCRFKLAAELAWFIDRNHLDGTPADEPRDDAESERRLIQYRGASAAVKDLAIGLDALDRIITREPIPVAQTPGIPADLDQLAGGVWNAVSEAGHATDVADFAVAAVKAAFGDPTATAYITQNPEAIS